MAPLRPRTSGGSASNLGICVLAGCALIAAATWATADSTARRQTRGTHLGVAPADTVMLSFSGNFSSQKFVRVREDGTTETAEYQVPAGHRLFITDVDWAGPGAAYPYVTLRVYVENRTTSTTRALVFVHHAQVAYNSGSSSGVQNGGINSGIVTGFTVGSAGRLVCDVVPANQPTAAFTTSGTTTPLVILRGYVVSED